VHLLAAAVGCLAVACLLYVLVDRPGLRDPLVALATIVTPLVGVAGLVRGGASRASE
jgi:multisubunit Na+/H+ antiporter MnhF subunit